ncbi:winged helix-turn-helix domain-containing protein [Aneurinibacillus aneurinilyticus]|uniref:winged helix-turn-helix domain-containing protein n=1 Tax=Aneurinibacillus aneurinilyticus TaxID=1391 RepID=UPI0030B816BD
MKQTPPPGKRPYLTEEEQQELKRMIVESTPAEEGLGLESCWNTRILQYVIEDKFAVTMSRSGITDLLHRLNLRYTRPTYTLVKANKEKQEAFVQQMDWIKKPHR